MWRWASRTSVGKAATRRSCGPALIELALKRGAGVLDLGCDVRLGLPMPLRDDQVPTSARGQMAETAGHAMALLMFDDHRGGQVISSP